MSEISQEKLEKARKIIESMTDDERKKLSDWLDTLPEEPMKSETRNIYVEKVDRDSNEVIHRIGLN